MNGSSRRWTPHASHKRKRDSELRSLSDLQLREAQEKVEQKRAKIAARVPAIAPTNARPASASFTSLADLYAQMRRDSGASGASVQQPTSSVVPTTNIVPENGRIPDGKVQNAPRGHSTTSSPDPIATMSEDDQEIVMLKHAPGDSPRERTGFKSEAVLARPTHSQSSSKEKSKTSTPKSAVTGGVPKLSFAVVVPSPPKRSTYKPTRVEREPPERDSLQLQYRTPAAPDHKENMNDRFSEPRATHTPTPALARPTRSLETIPDSTSEYGMRRFRRGMGPSEDLTARDLDILLDAVPVPFDFSLARRHLASHEKGEKDGQSEESSLWWYHPIFEARAKADIRRTLSALLPSDPAQDPPFPIGGAGGRKAEVRPRQSRARIWAERLEDAFGPGPLDRGLGRKPRRVARPAGAAKREGTDSLRFQNGGGAVVVIPTNSHRSTPRRILEPPSRRRSPKDAVADEAFTPPLEADGMVSVDAANARKSESEVVAWTAALLPLVKGKIMLDKAKIARISDALGEVERANQRGSFAREMLKESALGDTVRRLGELDGVPFGDIYGLRVRARTLTEQWREAFGDEVVDLQREVLLHVS